MTRRAYLVNVKVVERPRMPVVTVSRGYAGYSPGSTNDYVEVSADFRCTPDAARFFMTVVSNGGEIADVQAWAGDMGLDRPDLRRQRERGRPPELGTNEARCPDCSGAGSLEGGSRICPVCNGAGWRRDAVPAGTYSGRPTQRPSDGATLRAIASLVRLGDDVTPARLVAELGAMLQRAGLRPDTQRAADMLKGAPLETPDVWDAQYMGVPMPRIGVAQGTLQAAKVCGPCTSTAASLREARQAAGLPADGGWEELVKTIDALRTAALPPYEPKAPPAVERCQRCSAPAMVYLNRRTQVEFTGCSTWPSCRWTHVAPPKEDNLQAPAYARRKLEI